MSIIQHEQEKQNKMIKQNRLQKFDIFFFFCNNFKTLIITAQQLIINEQISAEQKIINTKSYENYKFKLN